jgi:hypothetical protein
MPFIVWPIIGAGWAWYNDKKDQRNIKPVQGPMEFNDYIDRPSWFNPISNTNMDSYFIGAVVLVLLYKIKVK